MLSPEQMNSDVAEKVPAPETAPERQTPNLELESGAREQEKVPVREASAQQLNDDGIEMVDHTPCVELDAQPVPDVERSNVPNVPTAYIRLLQPEQIKTERVEEMPTERMRPPLFIPYTRACFYQEPNTRHVNKIPRQRNQSTNETGNTFKHPHHSRRNKNNGAYFAKKAKKPMKNGNFPENVPIDLKIDRRPPRLATNTINLKIDRRPPRLATNICPLSAASSSQNPEADVSSLTHSYNLFLQNLNRDVGAMLVMVVYPESYPNYGFNHDEFLTLKKVLLSKMEPLISGLFPQFTQCKLEASVAAFTCANYPSKAWLETTVASLELFEGIKLCCDDWQAFADKKMKNRIWLKLPEEYNEVEDQSVLLSHIEKFNGIRTSDWLTHKFSSESGHKVAHFSLNENDLTVLKQKKMKIYLGFEASTINIVPKNIVV